MDGAQATTGGPDGSTGPRKIDARAQEAAWGSDGRTGPLMKLKKADGMGGPDGRTGPHTNIEKADEMGRGPDG